VNNLNSVLIEGEIEIDVAAYSSEAKIVSFTIASKRFYKSGDGIAEEVNYIDIETTGKLVEHCLNHIRKGRGVRVVGRMRQPKGKPAVIVAEHVEIRPEFKKSNTEDK
jgi:single-strand DNA-binding protein